MTNRPNPRDPFRCSDRALLRARPFFGLLTLLFVGGLALGQEPNAEPAPSEREPAAPADSAPPADAATLFQQAREELASYRTLKAKMVETIEFGPRRFKAEGDYLQGVDNRLRVDLAVSVGGNQGRLLQVSEGDVLWTVYEVGETPRITRRDVKQILGAVKSEQGVSAVSAELGLGGLPALLVAVEQSMDFAAPKTAVIDGRNFYIIEGQWKPPILAQFQQQAQQQPTPSAEPRPLPAHVPDAVRLYLDAESLFPYRIRYLKRSGGPGEAPRPLLTIDFRDIVVNANLDPSEFRYVAPEGAQVADITKHYVQQIQSQLGGQGTPPTVQPPQQPTAPPQQPVTPPQ